MQKFLPSTVSTVLTIDAFRLFGEGEKVAALMKPHCQQNGRFSKPSTDKSVVVHQQCKDFCHAYPKKKAFSPFQQKEHWFCSRLFGKGFQKHGYIACISFDRTFISIAPKMPNWVSKLHRMKTSKFGVETSLSLSKNLTFEGSDWCKKTSCTGWNDSNIVFKKVQFGVHTPQPRMQSSQGW